jgi:mono/diheme cytochrome c family protein
MRSRPPKPLLGLLLLAVALLVAAGCGSEGTVSPLPTHVTGALPKAPTVAKGDPVAGKAVFASAGCGSCHTYTPAGSSGKIGPDLDKLPDYAQKANEPLDTFTAGAITNPPPSYVPPGYPTNVMPTTFGQSLSQKQLADLVAFLTQKS